MKTLLELLAKVSGTARAQVLYLWPIMPGRIDESVEQILEHYNNETETK